MKNAVSIAALIVFAFSSAFADSIPWNTYAEMSVGKDPAVPNHFPSMGNSYLTTGNMSGITAASRSMEDDLRDGIGMVLVNEGATFTPTTSGDEISVPEPASLILLSTGIALAALRRRLPH